MTVHVEMTSNEFQEFLEWKKDKGRYNAELVGLRHKYKDILNKILFSIETDPKKKGKMRIADHEHAEELLEWALDLLERLSE